MLGPGGVVVENLTAKSEPRVDLPRARQQPRPGLRGDKLGESAGRSTTQAGDHTIATGAAR
jgi:hypothetical protein